jgi:hypothetical protein
VVRQAGRALVNGVFKLLAPYRRAVNDFRIEAILDQPAASAKIAKLEQRFVADLRLASETFKIGDDLGIEALDPLHDRARVVRLLETLDEWLKMRVRQASFTPEKTEKQFISQSFVTCAALT